MPAIFRAASGVVTSGSGFTIAETSASPQAGDYRYVFINCSPGATITLPSGWTSVFNGSVGSGTLAVGYKPWVAGVGTETVTLSGSSQIGAELVALGAVNTAVAPTAATAGSTTAGTSLTAASLTPTSADGFLIVYYAQTLTSGAPTATLSNPAGLSDLRTDNATVASSYVIRVSATALTTTAATAAYTSTASGSGTWRSATLFVPAAAGGGSTPAATGRFFPFLGLGTGVAR